ncbi:MAG: ribonuclease catalytic domain-containing protein [Bacilli bacterium]
MKNKKIEEYLKEEEFTHVDNIYTELLNNFYKTITKIGKALAKNILENDIDGAITIINNLSILVKDKEKIKKIKKVIEISNDDASFTTDDYQILMFLIFYYKDYELIKYFVLSKPNGVKVFKDALEEVLDYYLKLPKNNPDINYYEKILELFLYNMKPQDLTKNKGKYLQMINKSPCKNSWHIKKIFNIIEMSDHVTIKELGKKYRIKYHFPQHVIEEIPSIYQNLDNRVDLTQQNAITIDGAKTNLFDDAFYVLELPNGNYKLYIHIVDIPSYIKKTSNINNEAYLRGETLYLQDCIVPMIPDEITTFMCSLNKNSIKNAITYEINLDSNFDFIGNNILDYLKIYKSLICIKENYSYQWADRLIKDENGNNILFNAYLITDKLKRENASKEIYRNIQNRLDRLNYSVEPKESTMNNLSASIIQELMILVNHLTAEYFTHIDMPFMYRNSKRLSKEELNDKLKMYYDYINSNKFHLNELNSTNVRNIADILSRTAYYSIDNEGHFGLNMDTYSHSSSPMRRYADIISQRLIYDFIFNNYLNNSLIYKWEEEIEETSKHLNEKESDNEMFEAEYNFLIKRKILKKY